MYPISKVGVKQFIFNINLHVSVNRNMQWSRCIIQANLFLFILVVNRGPCESFNSSVG